MINVILRTKTRFGPAIIWCKNDVVLTLMRRDDVASTLIRRHFRTKCPLGAIPSMRPGRVAQSVGHLTRKSGVLGSIPGLATNFRFFFRFFKKGSCQLLEKVCARSTG